MGLPISLACADYARVMPLATGAVKADGIDLTMVLGQSGSWPARAKLLTRALTDPSVHGGEGSMAGHLRRIDQGDRSHIALPVFPLRNFTARDLYVRKDGPVKVPADLRGRCIGMYDWVASGSIWYRHFLRFVGIEPGDVKWCIGAVDEPRITNHVYTLPEGVMAAPEGRPVSDLLLNGEIDAVYSPPRPRKYHPVNGPIVRLFSDVRAVEQEYYRATGMFPPQHLILLRREVWEGNKWIAKALTEAFIRADKEFASSVRSFPYVSPWLDIELEETEALMGPDFHLDGYERNRETIEVFADQAHRIGVVSRRISAEEYFADYLESA